MRTRVFGTALLVLLGACGEPSADPAAAGASGSVEALRAAATSVAARAEHSATRVRVQHILIGFKGAMRSNASRTREEAEQLAAEIYGKATAPGADFGALMRQYSEDPGAGDYVMVSGNPTKAGEFPRSGMAGAFGDTGWRLEVGQIGVAPHDMQKSPFGWHLIKRVE